MASQEESNITMARYTDHCWYYQQMYMYKENFVGHIVDSNNNEYGCPKTTMKTMMPIKLYIYNILNNINRAYYGKKYSSFAEQSYQLQHVLSQW